MNEATATYYEVSVLDAWGIWIVLYTARSLEQAQQYVHAMRSKYEARIVPIDSGEVAA